MESTRKTYFWLSYLGCNDPTRDNKSLFETWQTLVDESACQPVACQIAMHFFIQHDYNEMEVSDFCFDVGKIRDLFEKHNMDYEFEVETDDSVKWYFPGAPENGSDVVRDDCESA